MEAVAGFPAKPVKLARQPPQFQCVTDRHHHAFHRERLGDEITGAFAHRLHGDVDRAIGGYHDDRAVDPHVADLAQYIHAGDIGQMQIQQHQVGRIALQFGYCFSPGDREAHGVASGGKGPCIEFR